MRTIYFIVFLFSFSFPGFCKSYIPIQPEQDTLQTGIVYNNAYTLNVKKLLIRKYGHAPETLDGNLKNFCSGIVQLSEHYYLYFTVVKEFEHGAPDTYVDYKIYEVFRGRSDILTDGNRAQITDKKAVLKAQNSPADALSQKQLLTGMLEFEIEINFK